MSRQQEKNNALKLLNSLLKKYKEQKFINIINEEDCKISIQKLMSYLYDFLHNKLSEEKLIKLVTKIKNNDDKFWLLPNEKFNKGLIYTRRYGCKKQKLTRDEFMDNLKIQKMSYESFLMPNEKGISKNVLATRKFSWKKSGLSIEDFIKKMSKRKRRKK